MADVIFRRADVSDVTAIVSLLADDPIGSGREALGDTRYMEAFTAIAADPNQLLLVADQAGAIVGCLQITFIPGLSRQGMWRGQIEGVRIADAHRGAGLGQRMIAWAIEACRARGCGLVQLTSDKRRAEAIHFYERLGFQTSHEGMKLTLT